MIFLAYYIFALCAFWASGLTDALYNKKGNLDNSKATPSHKIPDLDSREIW